MAQSKDDKERRKQERLAEALRENLSRRKGQMRARRAGEADERPEGLPGAGAEGDAGEEQGFAGGGPADNGS